MKQLLLLTLITLSVSAKPIVIHTKNRSQAENSKPVAQATDDDLDAKVVLANVANMLGCIGMLSTDPYNPAIAGPSLAQIGVSFINIITQIFKSQGFDEEITRANVETWFMRLSDDAKMEFLSLFITYANQVRSQNFCPNCECDDCRMHHMDCINCR